jgi:hypothetical protein
MILKCKRPPRKLWIKLKVPKLVEIIKKDLAEYIHKILLSGFP